MGVSRRGEREPGKSDQIDARAIARAPLREGIERFPTAFLDEDAAEIRLLCDHRDTLVNERTRLINRLRINLVVLDRELEAKIPSRKLDYPGQLQRIARRLRAMPQTARLRVARQQVKRIDVLTREAEALKRELRAPHFRSGCELRCLPSIRRLVSGIMSTPNGRPERISLRDEAQTAYRAMAAFDRSVELDSALHELVKIRASQLNGCAYCIEMHTKAARGAGESERRICALSAWRESPLFTERERTALELTDAITDISRGGVEDAVYHRAEAEFVPSELANLILAITAINAWNRIAVSTAMTYADKA